MVMLILLLDKTLLILNKALLILPDLVVILSLPLDDYQDLDLLKTEAEKVTMKRT